MLRLFIFGQLLLLPVDLRAYTGEGLDFFNKGRPLAPPQFEDCINCSESSTGTLKVGISSLKKGNHSSYGMGQGKYGKLIFSLCQSQKCYDSNGKDEAYIKKVTVDLDALVTGKASSNDQRPVVQLAKSSEPLSLSFELEQLPIGEYSFFVHHDRNGDGEIDNITCGLFGKPVDGLAFSQNKDPRDEWGKPAWKKVKFTIKDSKTTTMNVAPLYMCD